MPDKAVRSRPLIYIALPASYFIAGWLGLFLAVPPGYATAIFLPAGIAVTAMFIAGPVILPSVFIGSLILDGWVGYSNNYSLDLIEVAAALAIAAASTMQAGIGGSVLRRLIGYPASFDNPHDLLSYLAATPLICVTSATLAIGGLWSLGIVQSNSLPRNWLTWWAGDSLGVLVALPLMLILFGTPRAIWQYRGPQVAIPMLISFGVFVIFFIYFQSWAVLVVGGLGTGLLGAFLLLITGQAFRIAADFRALTRINQLSSQLMRPSAELQTSLFEILDVAIELSEAEKGNIQLLDEASGGLKIASQRGFEEPFLAFFTSVHAADNSACAAAVDSRHRIVVEDVLKSEIFDGLPSQKVLLDAGVRAVTSTPLISSSGNVLGMISTHFAEIHRASASELSWMDLLSRQAADFLDRKRAEEIEKTLVHEVQHRSNNLLGVVQAIVHRSFSDKSSVTDVKAAIEGRLQSLARVNRKLSGARSERVSMDEIVRAELEAFQERTSLQGARIEFGPQIAQRLSLAIHELATNAAKYGALCTAEGKVQVSWAVNGDGDQQSLKFKWQERGGPAISAPTVSGFGTTLLRTVFKEVRFDYAKEGLSCDITIPFSKLEAGLVYFPAQN